MPNKKIKKQDDVAKIVYWEKAADRVVGFTNGCFDILHAGHVAYLEKAKEKCDVLIIGVNSDSSVKRIKGDKRPINGEKSRLAVLAALEVVDYVTLFKESTPKKLIELITPNVLFKGGDWDEKDIVGGRHVKASGGKVEVIPYVKGFSTTDLIKRIKKKG